jgi:hypothetical protein
MAKRFFKAMQAPVLGAMILSSATLGMPAAAFAAPISQTRIDISTMTTPTDLTLAQYYGRPVRRPPVVVRPGRPVVGRPVVVAPRRWVRPGHYRWRPGGAIAAGAALGFLAAGAAYWSRPPAPGMCWYYTSPSRRSGFWDYCP